MVSTRLLVVSLACLCQIALAVLVNRTVDDSEPFIIYTPPLNWHSSTVSCAACLQPNISRAYGQSFHDGTGGLQDRIRKVESDGRGDAGADGDNDEDDVNPQILRNPVATATFGFKGVAVFVFCIIPDGNDDNHVSMSNLSFALDGKPVGRYLHQPQLHTALSFLYNRQVFAVTDLPNSQHEFTVSASPDSALLLDYFVYTTDVNETSTNTKSSAVDENHGTRRNTVSFAVAVGASLGVLSAVTIALCTSLYCRRRRSALHTPMRVEPVMQGPGAFIPQYFPGSRPESESASPVTVPNSSRSPYLAPSHSPPLSSAHVMDESVVGDDPPPSNARFAGGNVARNPLPTTDGVSSAQPSCPPPPTFEEVYASEIQPPTYDHLLPLLSQDTDRHPAPLPG